MPIVESRYHNPFIFINSIITRLLKFIKCTRKAYVPLSRKILCVFCMETEGVHFYGGQVAEIWLIREQVQGLGQK